VLEDLLLGVKKIFQLRPFATDSGSFSHFASLICLIRYWLVVLTCFNHLEKYESMGRIISENNGKKMFETPISISFNPNKKIESKP
jgi:hypothetical protein